MRWVTYRSPGVMNDRVGLVDGDSVRGLRGSWRLIDLLGDHDTRLARAADMARRCPFEVVPLGEVELRAPIPAPPSIRDFMAFEGHLQNVIDGFEPWTTIDPEWYEMPLFYFTNPAAVLGPHDDVAIAPGSEWFDFELEIAAVVGREGANLTPEQAASHIAGFMLMCDWSARDVQLRETRIRLSLGPAKGKDSATSFGPWLVTVDELAPHATDRSYDLATSASVNGKHYSAGNAADMYWSFAELLSYASRGTRLVPGDVIGSGTVPTGSILELSALHGADAFPWLQPGDEVALSVEKLGSIKAGVVPAVPLHPVQPPAPRRATAPVHRRR